MLHPRPRLVGALAASVLVLGGCGFLDAMAHPEERRSSSGPSSPPAPAPVAPATPTRDPDEPVVVARADVTATDGEPLGTVQVSPPYNGPVIIQHKNRDLHAWAA